MNESEAVKLGFARINNDNHEWRDGYHVRYENPDGSTYDSWSPKDVFEKAYQIAETYLDRMRIELQEIKSRLMKLNDFLYSEKRHDISKNEVFCLDEQKHAMERYLGVLLGRIRNAEHPNEIIKNESTPDHECDCGMH